MFSPPLLYLTSTLATGFPSASLTVIITIPFSVELKLKVVSTAGSLKLNEAELLDGLYDSLPAYVALMVNSPVKPEIVNVPSSPVIFESFTPEVVL